MLTRCPHCGETAVDPVKLICQTCGMVVTAAAPVFNEAALLGIMHNIRVALQALEPGSFQQVAGPFSEREGHDASDAVPFTKQTCEIVHRACLEGRVNAIRVAVTSPGHTEWSLVIANHASAIEKAIKEVRKAARRMRVQIHVYHRVPNA